MGVGHEHCCQTGGREILRNGDFENATLERNVSTHHVPLEICWRRADKHCFCLCCPQLNGTGSFSFACWCKRVPSARSCSDPMYRLTVSGPLFSVWSWSVVLFSLGIRIDTTNCNMFATSYMSASYLSSFFPLLMFKTEFGAFVVSNVWTLPPSPPETRPHYGMSHSSCEHRCGLESSVIWDDMRW